MATAKTGPLKGIRILSLALNLPGPAALMRLRAMGAQCTKVEPPSGDPMAAYSKPGYDSMHGRLKIRTLDLKTDQGQRQLQQALGKTDVLMTSFRPSALKKLGLDWKTVSMRHPQLSMVAIFGAPGAMAEHAGHDLTYMAANDLIDGLRMPTTLFADMAGALLATEAVMACVLRQKMSGIGCLQEVALTEGSQWLALPRAWGVISPNQLLGGQHAGYRMYACKDGRVAMAALEHHFATRLFDWVGIPIKDISKQVFEPKNHKAIAKFLAERHVVDIERFASENDMPLHTLPA